MGVVNVTPDSFSDGGRFDETDAAITHGLALRADGADILDIGGESTRPGATRPLVEQELARVIPVIAALSGSGAVVSVDTMRSEVAAAALDAGATVVNDVSGGLADPAMHALVAARSATYVAMHWRAHADQMQAFTTYDDGVVTGVRDELARRVDAMTAAGIDRDRIVLDPGLGFAKLGPQNWELLRGLAALEDLGLPLLVGASRKAFFGTLLAGPDGTPRPVEGREFAGAALAVLLAQRGVWGLRVHDVRATCDALAVWQELEGATHDG